ncbi:MAG: hypothetical protein H6618_08360 [Deltaproteobacteria bacterium]|nr:hypothetical protein [Deltaproteobacteria bacterium]
MLSRVLHKYLLCFLALSLLNVTTFSHGKEADTELQTWWKTEKFFQSFENLAERLRTEEAEVASLCSEQEALSFEDRSIFRQHLQRAMTYLQPDRASDMPAEKQFKNFLDELRSALESKFYTKNKDAYHHDACVRLAQNLVFSYYTKNRLHSFIRELFTRTVDFRGWPLMFADPEALIQDYRHQDDSSSVAARFVFLEKLIAALPMIHQRISERSRNIGYSYAKRLQDLYRGGVSWYLFDPAMIGNFPYLKYEIQRSGQEHPLIYIRMPTPTLGSNAASVKLAPEFTAYLHYLKAHQLRHLYINFQDALFPSLKTMRSLRDLRKLFGLEDESGRARLLQNLGQQSELSSVVEVLSLNHNSTFYEQSGNWNRYSTAEAGTFMKQFAENLFREKEGYQVPLSWQEGEDQFFPEIMEILSFVHHVFFNKAPFLDRKSRQIFIDLAHAFISEFAGRGFFSVNQSCKSGIDRAGAANGMTLLLYLAKMAFDSNVSDAEFISTSRFLLPALFGDALITKMRAIKKVRLKRFFRSASLLIRALQENPERSQLFIQRLSAGSLLSP